MKNRIFTAETQIRGVMLPSLQRRGGGASPTGWFSIFLLSVLLYVSALNIFSQETPPVPSAPRSASIPAVKEKKLPNGLTVAVVERKNVPLVTVQLLVRSGASAEDAAKAGLASLTASMLTKGTKTRTATQIAEQMEFLGGALNAGAGWNNSVVTITVTSDKLDKAMAIMADVVLNPAFDQKELDLLKSQALDGLTFSLKQPGFLASYAASTYSFNEHPAGGTPSSLQGLSREIIAEFHKTNYVPNNSVIIFTGDITAVRANSLTAKLFARWPKPKLTNAITELVQDISPASLADEQIQAESGKAIKRILVIDLPNSGQASVNYGRHLEGSRVENWNVPGKTKVSSAYFPASVLNSLLGGGYSSRLNQEIRIKRGLSYGAGSNFAWRADGSNFSTRTQTKNESAAEVVELVLAEIRRLTNSSATESELVPRKSVLTGGFGRNLETTAGLAAALADLYIFDLPTSELNSYVKSVNSVTDAQIRDFAAQNLLGGDIIIVGDYSVFKDDLAKRFPEMKIVVIKADELDLSKKNLRK